MPLIVLKCPSCGYTGNAFRDDGKGNYICPACGSLLTPSESSALLNLLQEEQKRNYLFRIACIVKRLQLIKEAEIRKQEKRLKDKEIEEMKRVSQAKAEEQALMMKRRDKSCLLLYSVLFSIIAIAFIIGIILRDTDLGFILSGITLGAMITIPLVMTVIKAIAKRILPSSLQGTGNKIVDFVIITITALTIILLSFIISVFIFNDLETCIVVSGIALVFTLLYIGVWRFMLARDKMIQQKEGEDKQQ